MAQKAKKYLGLSYLPLAFVFLFNPDIAVIDMLPDLIGYLIMCSALINLSDMNYYIEDACRLFKKAALLSLFRIVSIFVIFGLFGAQEHYTSLLLFSFVFGVLDLVVLIPAYKKLFEGLLYAGNMCDGEAVFKYRLGGEKVKKEKKSKEKRGRRNITAKASALCVAFVVVKVLCSTLPEFSTLADNQAYEFLSLLRSVGFAIALYVGVAWMIYMIRYISAIRRDKAFVEKLTAKYNEEILPKVGMFTSRRLCRALTVASAAILLTIDLYSDNLNILPDLLCPAALIVFFAMLRPYYKKYKMGIALSAITLAVAVAEWVQSILFYTEFYPGAVSKNIEAYVSYYIMFSLVILKLLLMLCLVGLTFFAIYEVSRRHTGRKKTTDIDSAEHDNAAGEECREFRIKLIIYFVVSCISALATEFNIWSQPMSVDNWFFQSAQVIDMTVGIVFAALTVSLIYDIKKEIQNKYILD